MNLLNKYRIILMSIGFIFIYSHFSACFDTIFFKHSHNSMIKDICCMKFDTNYLVAIIAFYGAVIAFFIPFTIDMSNTLKKQFGNDIIAKRFDNEKVVKTLHIKLLINTFIASFILLFYVNLKGIILLVSNIIILSILVYSINIFFDIYNYVKLLKKYTNENEVLEMLQKEISDAIK